MQWTTEAATLSQALSQCAHRVRWWMTLVQKVFRTLQFYATQVQTHT